MDNNKSKENKVLRFPSGQNIKAQTPEEEIYDIAYVCDILEDFKNLHYASDTVFGR